MADLKYLRYKSLETGFGLNYISKEEKLSLLLYDLSTLLTDKFIIKGGTALNRAYLINKGLSRFSEDIDIDYIAEKKFDEKIKDTAKIMDKIKSFDVAKSRLMNKTLRYDCYYINELNHKDRIQVEFYLAHDKIICQQQPGKKTLKSSFIESQLAYLRVYSFEDLFARKIIACLNRMEGKDIYDLFYCFEVNFDKKTLKKAIVKIAEFYGLPGNAKEIIIKLIQKLNSVENQYYIGTSTNHFIPRNLRPDWKIIIISLADKLKLNLLL